MVNILLDKYKNRQPPELVGCFEGLNKVFLWWNFVSAAGGLSSVLELVIVDTNHVASLRCMQSITVR